MWQWWNFSEGQCMDKPTLRINLDETACRLHYDQKRGLAVTRERGLTRGRKAEIVQDVSRQKLRGCFTHVAMICDDASLQPRLPQIFIGNEHIFAQRIVDAVQPDLPKNILLWRRKSAWVQHSTMVEVVRALAAALGGDLRERRVLLLLDACRVHMGVGFLRSCAARGILVHYVPAQLTWLLQPLDTHAFSKFKVVIGCEYRREVMKSGHCELSAMLRIVAYAVRKVFQGTHWSRAFDSNGFGHHQARVRQTILERLEWEPAVGVSSRLPSLAQFTSIFPRRASLPLGDLLSCHRHRAAVAAPLPGPPEALEPPRPAPASDPSPWHGRLRSSSALSLVGPEEELSADPAAASAPLSSGAASSSHDGAVALPAPPLERLFVPIIRPPAPRQRKRKSPAT